MAKKPVKKTAAKKTVKKAAAAKKAPARKPVARKAPAAKKAPAKKTGGLASLFKPVKQSVTIRLDSDVVAWFKKQADKYQTEINSVLRSHASKRGL